MTPAVYQFVESLELSGKVLDVGSFNVNGCVRALFPDYTGVDMRPGRNVDQVANAHNLPFPDEHFDHVLSLEMIEHDDAFWSSFEEMKRVLRPGGMLVITTRGIGFPKHEYPSDYWRFTREALVALFHGMERIRVVEDTKDMGVFGCACKSSRRASR
ncbi:MAG: methyltransferase domain-containing protein [Acidobacteriota bacterium]